MEDSFVDFQEKKKIKTGPKVDPKAKKSNQKKLKHSKGQKDIRSLIKKNELVSYSQDFDLVCKQSGVDVDAEQLQLAIALSKSINEFQSSSEDVEIQNKQLSSQERSAKIRTTLQEYGFKVNKSKILLALSKNKRKKYKKHSKLLQISSEERQQKISNKYAQVLASNNSKSPKEDPKCIYLKHTTFYKSTNIPYDLIKNNEIYYVGNLIDQPTHKTCLLRDWSEIPGRPVSPKPTHNDINFETVHYSLEELDNILSGSIDMAQNIVNSKLHVKENKSFILDPSNEYNYIKNETIDIIEPTPPCSNNLKNNEIKVSVTSETNEITEVQVVDIQDSEKCSSIIGNVQENIECVDLIKDIIIKNNLRKSLTVIDAENLNSRKFRSASPDLFDDEVCTIIEDKNDCSTIETNVFCSIIEEKNNCSTMETIDVSSIIENKNPCSTRKSISKYNNGGTIFMDLTECANNNYSNLNGHNIDITKRKSNDLMDITECVNVKSMNNNHIDGILSSGETNEDNKVEEHVVVDLTQVSNLVHCSPDIGKRGTKRSDSLETDDTVIYDKDVLTKTVNESKDLQELIVLDNDESIAKHVMNDEKFSEYYNRENHHFCKSDDKNVKSSEKNIENMDFDHNSCDDINIDLTQGSAQSEDLINYPEIIYDDCGYGELEHNIGALTNKDNDIIALKSVSFHNDFENQDGDIDLTPNLEKTFEENYLINCPGTSHNNNSGLENFDYDCGTIDNKNNSIVIVEDIPVNNELVDKNYKEYNIDLTQIIEENEEKNIAPGYVHTNNSKLGKIDNISIDYDEMFDEITSESKNASKNTFKNSSNEKDVNSSNPSIDSEVFEISDKELNYSIHHSIHENINIDFENTRRVSLNRSLSDSHVPTVHLSKALSPIKEKCNSQSTTPTKINRDIGDAIIKTPKNNEYIIKTREVTPMADYESMTTPERNEELEKYGLKPFKRKRAIQLLTYVYNQTHPVIESCSPEEGPSKKFKRDNKYSSPRNNSKSPKKSLDFGSDVNKENDIFVVTKETPDIKNIKCDPKEWVFQNREKAKVHSCRVPLHIAFHNYVSCRKLLREAILRYEPVNIDIIHKDLVGYGHKYNPKDLLKFMDRKCITVKTIENNSRNKKNIA